MVNSTSSLLYMVTTHSTRLSAQGFEMRQKLLNITQSSISRGLSAQGWEQPASYQEHSTLPPALE